MLVTFSMITKKIMLASAAIIAVLGYATSQMIAPAEASAAQEAGLAARDARQATMDLPTGPKLTPAALADADILFDDDAEAGVTRALLVMQDGKLVYERYGNDFGPETKMISWSMAKTITAVMIGLLVSDGRLSLDSPAPVAAWQRSGDPRGNISLRHLLHMASGLEHREGGDPLWEADTVAMLFGAGADDMAAFAQAKPAIAQAGEQFNYSTATSVILSDIIANTLTASSHPKVRRDAVLEFMRGRLSEPLGMASLTAEFDARGTMIGGSILHATAQDYARFGEFLRNRGVANGQRIFPESWMQFMLKSSPADAGYGAHIWLNRGRPAGSNEALWPDRGPNDLYAAIGHQGQYIIVSPSQRATVVRLGITREDEFPMLRRRLADLMEQL